MTTIVYRKCKYIAADKRRVGWDAGMKDDMNKIHKISHKDYYILLSNAWPLLMYNTINRITRKNIIKNYSDENIYALRKDFEDHCSWKEFAFIIIIIDKQTGFTEAFKCASGCVEEITDEYCCVWSWAWALDWLLKYDPEVSPEKIFEIASMDQNTSPTYTIDYFNKYKK